MVDGKNTEQRYEIDYALTPDEDVIIDDPDLPAELRGMRPPSWYRPAGR